MDNKINFSNWREFEIGNILKRKKIKSVSKILSQLNSGDTVVVGNSSDNNGIIDMVSIDDKSYLHEPNTLSYGAKGGKFFFQKKPWLSTDHVHQFFCENINDNNQLFICTVLNKLLEIKGGWCSSLESNIVYEKILLPAKNNYPDWEYMENYIKLLRERERELSTFWILFKNNYQIPTWCY